MQNNNCILMPWDSSFFGIRIARLNGPRLSEHSLAQALEWCGSHEIDCLYFLADSDHNETVRLAENNSFRLVDIPVTLTLKSLAEGNDYNTAHGVRLFREEDLDCLKAIARQSHSDSRFYFDGRFPKERCDDLFATWIERSCQGWAAAVFVGELDRAIAGYCTCHIDGDAGLIGLMAVAPQAQGRSLGRRLVGAAVSYANSRGISRINVVTQGRNVRAQRTYQKSGFITDSVMLWYHKWFREPAPSRPAGS